MKYNIKKVKEHPGCYSKDNKYCQRCNGVIYILSCKRVISAIFLIIILTIPMLLWNIITGQWKGEDEEVVNKEPYRDKKALLILDLEKFTKQLSEANIDSIWSNRAEYLYKKIKEIA